MSISARSLTRVLGIPVLGLALGLVVSASANHMYASSLPRDGSYCYAQHECGAWCEAWDYEGTNVQCVCECDDDIDSIDLEGGGGGSSNPQLDAEPAVEAEASEPSIEDTVSEPAFEAPIRRGAQAGCLCGCKSDEHGWTTYGPYYCTAS